MKKKTFCLYIVFIVSSMTITSCHKTQDQIRLRSCGTIEKEILFRDEFSPDSIDVLLPSLACSECLATSKHLFRRFRSKEKLKFIVQPGLSMRNTKIIYSNELSQMKGLNLDSIGQYSNITGNDSQNIWIVVYDKYCEYSLRIEGGMENDLIYLFSRM